MLLGLTGAIGCGKSTAMDIFRDSFSFEIIKTDDLSKEILFCDKQVLAKINSRWNLDISLAKSDKKLFAKKISEIVFSNKDELKFLEDLLHPKVFEKWYGYYKENSNINLIVEIPLLFEKNYQNLFDKTICVASPYNIALKRAKLFTKENFDNRAKNQYSLKRKIDYADLVLFNSSDIYFLKEQIKQVCISCNLI